MEFEAIGANDIEKYLSMPMTKLIDLREKEEFNLYHLQGAENIPYDDLGKYKDRLSKNITYILYCERGGSSLMAAKELSKEGYRVYTLIGGLKALKERVLK